MPPENRRTTDEAFRELENQLAALRTASKALREQRPSVAGNLFHPARRAKEEAEFGAAVVAALKEFGSSIRAALAEQEAKLAELERQLSEVRDEQRELGWLRERQEQLAREQATAVSGTTELRQQIERLEREHSAKVEQVTATLGNELRERIQHLLDEQRVAIRQLALKASEDAILSDRARRATESKLDELAKRIPPAPPAPPA